MIAFLLLAVAVLIIASAAPDPVRWISVVFTALAIVAYFAGGHLSLHL